MDSLYKTCKLCREKATAYNYQKRAQAESRGIYMLFYLLFLYRNDVLEGMHWCTTGAHCVSVEECLTEDGAVCATCAGCRTRLRVRTAAAALACEQADALSNEYEHVAGDDDAEGVQAIPVDEFDEIFGDGNDLMDVDLPDDRAVSAREKELLTILDQKLAEIMRLAIPV